MTLLNRAATILLPSVFIIASFAVTGAATSQGPPQTVADADRMLRDAAGLAKSGKGPEALQVATRAAALYEALRGPNDPGLVDYLDAVGRLNLSANNFPDAAAALQREIDLLRRVAPSEDRQLALALGNLAAAKRRLGQLVDAQSLLEQALTAHERLLPKSESDVAGTLANLSLVQSARAD